MGTSGAYTGAGGKAGKEISEGLVSCPRDSCT